MRTSARCRHAQSGGHEAACTPHTSAGGHHARSGRQPSRPTLLQGVPSRQNRPTRKRPSNYPARPTPLTFPHTFPTQSQAGVRVLRPVRKDRGDRRTPRCRPRHLRSTLEYSACRLNPSFTPSFRRASHPLLPTGISISIPVHIIYFQVSFNNSDLMSERVQNAK